MPDSRTRHWPLRLLQLSPLAAIALLTIVWFSAPSVLAVSLMSSGSLSGGNAATPATRVGWLDNVAADKQAIELGLTGNGPGFQSIAQDAWTSWADGLGSDPTTTAVFSAPPISADATAFAPVAEWERAHDARVWTWIVPAPPRAALVASAVGDPTALADARREPLGVNDSAQPGFTGPPPAFLDWLWAQQQQQPLGSIPPLPTGMLQSGPDGGMGNNSLQVDPYTLMGGGKLYRALVVRTVDPSANEGPTPIEELSKVDPSASDLQARISAVAKAEKVDIWVFGPLDMRAIPLRLPPRATAGDAERLGGLVWPSLAFDFNTQPVALLPLTGEAATAASGTVASVQLVGVDNTDYWNTIAQLMQPNGAESTQILAQTVAFVVVWNRPPAKATALQSAWSRWQHLIVGWFPLFFGAAMALLALTLVASPAAFVFERRLAARVRAREEMARLRRDVHDRVYNRLSALSKRVAASGQEVNTRNSAALGAIAEDIRSTVGELQAILGDEVRHANRALTSVPLAEQIASICVAQATRLDVDVACDTSDEPLPEVDARLGWDLQCIAEEAISNAVRHGSATHVRVRIALEDGAIELRVADDGSGSAVLDAASAPEGSTGLRGTSARVSRWGGSLELTPDVGGGTVLVARLPLGKD